MPDEHTVSCSLGLSGELRTNEVSEGREAMRRFEAGRRGLWYLHSCRGDEGKAGETGQWNSDGSDHAHKGGRKLVLQFLGSGGVREVRKETGKDSGTRHGKQKRAAWLNFETQTDEAGPGKIWVGER